MMTEKLIKRGKRPWHDLSPEEVVLQCSSCKGEYIYRRDEISSIGRECPDCSDAEVTVQRPLYSGERAELLSCFAEEMAQRPDESPNLSNFLRWLDKHDMLDRYQCRWAVTPVG